MVEIGLIGCLNRGQPSLGDGCPSTELCTKADLKETELRLSEKIIQSERAARTLIFIAYGGICVCMYKWCGNLITLPVLGSRL